MKALDEWARFCHRLPEPWGFVLYIVVGVVVPVGIAAGLIEVIVAIIQGAP